MNADQIFKEKIGEASDFRFGKQVANVFDDMVNRSVPYYTEIQRMIAEQAADHAIPNTNVYDLGCSTGTTFLLLNDLLPENIRFVGVDDSEDMLRKCRSKLKKAGIARAYDLQLGDMNSSACIENASVVILCLSLQFVRPIYREKLLKTIFDGIVDGGVFILVEKILAEDSCFNRNFIRYYYDYKRRQHYSEMEIAQKREALENVLIPYKLSENLHLLETTGFSHAETFFKWYNFTGIIAKK